MSVARMALIGVGSVSIIVAILGLIYNANSLSTDFSELNQRINAPYFYTALYVMSAICILCYLCLAYVGVQLIRGRTNVLGLLLFVIVFEVLYFFAVGILWLLPNYGLSIAAATGVANGGMMFQAFILFPLWAPIVAYIASQNLLAPRRA